MMEELKQKAKDFINRINKESDDGMWFSKYFLSDLLAMFATENGIRWHDLRKDPNDLPKKDETFTTEVSVPVMVHPSYQFACYYFDNKKWFSLGKELNIIAWCEIPKFEEAKQC